MALLLLALLLSVPSRAETPLGQGYPQWWERPVAVHLEPVGPAWVPRYLTLLDARLAGPRASPTFRRPVARAWVHFAIQAWGAEPVEIEDEAQEQMLVVLGAAMGMAADDFGREILYRSDELAAVHDAARTVLSPGLLVQKRDQGTRVTAVPPVGGHDRYARQRDRDELDGPPRPRPPPQPTFQVGTGLSVRGLDEDEDLPLVDGAVFVTGQWLGPVDGWRLSGLVVSRQWSASVRERLYPGLHLTLGLRSVKKSYEPAALTLGLNTRLDRLGARHWIVRASYTHSLVWAEVREERFVVELRHNQRWRAVQSPRSWVPGNRVEREGLSQPGYLPESGELHWLVEPDVTDFRPDQRR